MDTTTQKTVRIDGRDIVLKATARTPRLYRQLFGRDMIQDMAKLRDAYGRKQAEDVDLSAVDLTMFENLAYTMAKQGDPSIPDSPDDWLEQFNCFSIYEVLPQLFELWGMNLETQAESKKALARLTAK